MKSWNEMTPRERDAVVAEKAMGWIWVKRTDLNRNPKHPGFTPWKRYLTELPLADWQVVAELELPIEERYDIPPYTTDIKAAWGVVEKLERNEFALQLWGSEKNDFPQGWYAHFTHDYWIEDGYKAHVKAETVPEAICLAALKACDIDIK